MAEWTFLCIVEDLVRFLAALWLMLTRRCDWQTATERVAAWETRMNERTSWTPRSRAMMVVMLGGGLIFVTVMLVVMARIAFKS